MARLLVTGLDPLLRRAFDEKRLARGGLLRPGAVVSLWQEHQARRRDNGRLLWNLLMLQLWHSRFFENGDLLEQV